jgi:hypothetical protein
MTDRCPDCGADIALVGIRHLCKPRPTRAAEAATSAANADKAMEAWASENRGSLPPSGASTKPKGSSPPSSRKRTRKLPSTKAGHPRAKPGRSPAKKSKIKTGRPRLEDRDKTLTATKPWKAAKMSRATWYRRQAEKGG